MMFFHDDYLDVAHRNPLLAQRLKEGNESLQGNKPVSVHGLNPSESSSNLYMNWVLCLHGKEILEEVSPSLPSESL